jgi:hypothetical protein
MRKMHINDLYGGWLGPPQLWLRMHWMDRGWLEGYDNAGMYGPGC